MYHQLITAIKTKISLFGIMWLRKKIIYPYYYRQQLNKFFQWPVQSSLVSISLNCPSEIYILPVQPAYCPVFSISGKRNPFYLFYGSPNPLTANCSPNSGSTALQCSCHRKGLRLTQTIFKNTLKSVFILCCGKKGYKIQVIIGQKEWELDTMGPKDLKFWGDD